MIIIKSAERDTLWRYISNKIRWMECLMLKNYKTWPILHYYVGSPQQINFMQKKTFTMIAKRIIIKQLHYSFFNYKSEWSNFWLIRNNMIKPHQKCVFSFLNSLSLSKYLYYIFVHTHHHHIIDNQFNLSDPTYKHTFFQLVFIIIIRMTYL